MALIDFNALKARIASGFTDLAAKLKALKNSLKALAFKDSVDWNSATDIVNKPNVKKKGDALDIIKTESAQSTGIMIGNNSQYQSSYSSIWFDAIDGDFTGENYGMIAHRREGYMLYDIGYLSPNPFHVFIGGNIGINTFSPTSKLDVNGTTGHQQLRLRTPYTPTASSDNNGQVGQVAWDDNFAYFKTNYGWRKAPLIAIEGNSTTAADRVSWSNTISYGTQYGGALFNNLRVRYNSTSLSGNFEISAVSHNAIAIMANNTLALSTTSYTSLGTMPAGNSSAMYTVTIPLFDEHNVLIGYGIYNITCWKGDFGSGGVVGITIQRIS